MHWAWKTGVGGDCNLELAMFIRVSLEGTLTLRMKRERDCPLATRSKQLHHALTGRMKNTWYFRRAVLLQIMETAIEVLLCSAGT